MGYVSVNWALVGLFAFGAVHYCTLWWLSRRETILLVFATHCVLVAALSGAIAAVATASTPGMGQTALNFRTTFSLLSLATTAWLISQVTGVPARRFVVSIMAFLIGAATVHVFLFPFSGIVTGLTRMSTPWGENVTILQRASPRWWIVGPLYCAGLAVPIFGLVAAVPLWARDRINGLLVATASGTTLVAAVAAAFIDMARLPWPYIGTLPQAVWVGLIALLLSREYVRRAEHIAAGERQFRAIFDQTFQFIGLMKVDGTLIAANRTALAFAGIPEQDVIGQPFWDTPWWRHSPDLQARLRAAVKEAAAGSTMRFEATHPRPDGGLAYVDFSLKPVRDEQGAVTLLIPEGRDITERKLSEEALRELLSRHQAILESSLDGLIVIDALGRILEFNPAAEIIFGYRREEAVGRLLVELIVPPSLRRVYTEGLEHYRGTREGVILGHRFETSALRANGTEVRVELSIQPIAGADSFFFAGVVRDITERLHLEEQLRQSQKMDAIGQFAGGVAHDFNNLLTVIAGYGGLLMIQLPEGDPLREYAKAINDAGERAASLTSRLLAFSRRSVLAPEILDLNRVIEETQQLLRRVIGAGVRLTVALNPDVRHVNADRTHLDQVLINLALNARDAMPTGGSLIMETDTVTVSDSTDHADAPPGSYVRLTVSDTGSGMTPEVKARIFEPFFTTKGVGKGTGLGLSVVHGIVKQSGGHIEVETKPDVGTTFKIYLPAVGEQTRAALRGVADSRIASGSETILLVEDEDGVRDLMALSLREQGFKVLPATNGREALRLVEQHDGIDLMVTDLVMPDINGRELAGMMRARIPGLRVLFVSGYAGDPVLPNGMVQSSESFLQKPFAPRVLARKVRDVLDVS